jgi:hypothetical protein
MSDIVAGGRQGPAGPNGWQVGARQRQVRDPRRGHGAHRRRRSDGRRRSADCTMTASADTFEGIIDGDINPTMRLHDGQAEGRGRHGPRDEARLHPLMIIDAPRAVPCRGGRGAARRTGVWLRDRDGLRIRTVIWRAGARYRLHLLRPQRIRREVRPRDRPARRARPRGRRLRLARPGSLRPAPPQPDARATSRTSATTSATGRPSPPPRPRPATALLHVRAFHGWLHRAADAARGHGLRGALMSAPMWHLQMRGGNPAGHHQHCPVREPRRLRGAALARHEPRALRHRARLRGQRAHLLRATISPGSAASSPRIPSSASAARRCSGPTPRSRRWPASTWRPCRGCRSSPSSGRRSTWSPPT